MKKVLAIFMAVVMLLSMVPSMAFAEDDALNYLVYEIVNDEVTITGNKNNPVNIVIPAEIEGKPVTSIVWHAFYNCSNLSSVTIPNSVTSIDDSAFYGCSALQSITIPDSVTNIGDEAFRGCSSLNEFIVDVNNENYCSIDGILFSSDKTTLIDYPNGKNDDTYIIPDYVKSIGDYAFEESTSLQGITIPDSVTKIGSGAFVGCINLSSITISDSVISIGSVAFERTAYYNNASNWENGVLYIGNYLIRAKEDITGDCTIKDGTKNIAGFAFYFCNLKNINIPNSLMYISDQGFLACDFEEINYFGTQEQWNAITIGFENFHPRFTIINFIPDQNINEYPTNNSDHKKGDINGDGKVTASDARIILRIATKLETIEKYNVDIAAIDTNGDGKITALDARKVLRVATKLEKF